VKQGFVIWFTGLPSSGKTTLARHLEQILLKKNRRVEVLDGDQLRRELDPEVGFSKTDREIHIRRVAYVSKLLARNGIIVLVSLVSPYRNVRVDARKKIVNFVEVWVKCSIEKCIERDVKGLYKKALTGEIPNMTGIQDPYEEPVSPEVIVNTENESIKKSITKIIDKLIDLKYLPKEFNENTD